MDRWCVCGGCDKLAGGVGGRVCTYVYAGAYKQETLTINEGFSGHVMQNGTCS